jgi:hypothetical protein
LLLSRRYAPFERPNHHRMRRASPLVKSPYTPIPRPRRRRVGLPSGLPIERQDSDREMILPNLYFLVNRHLLGRYAFLSSLV